MTSENRRIITNIRIRKVVQSGYCWKNKIYHGTLYDFPSYFAVIVIQECKILKL